MTARTKIVAWVLGALALLGWLGWEWWTAPTKALLWHLRDAPEVRASLHLTTRGSPGFGDNAWLHYRVLGDHRDQPWADRNAAFEGLINSGWCQVPFQHYVPPPFADQQWGNRTAFEVWRAPPDSPEKRWRAILLDAALRWDFRNIQDQIRGRPANEFIAESEWDFARGAKILDDFRPAEEMVQPIIEAVCADHRHCYAWWFYSDEPSAGYLRGTSESGPWTLFGRQRARGAYIAEGIQRLRRRLAEVHGQGPDEIAHIANELADDLERKGRKTIAEVARSVAEELQDLADRSVNQKLFRIAWAAAWYYSETGAFPRDLDSLIPKYLSSPPTFPCNWRPVFLNSPGQLEIGIVFTSLGGPAPLVGPFRRLSKWRVVAPPR